MTGLAQRRMMESLVRMWGSVLLQEGKKDVQGVGTPGAHGEAGGDAFMPPGVGTRRFFCGLVSWRWFCPPLSTAPYLPRIPLLRPLVWNTMPLGIKPPHGLCGRLRGLLWMGHGLGGTLVWAWGLFWLTGSVQETKTPGVVMDAFLKLFCPETDSQEAWDSEDREGRGGVGKSRRCKQPHPWLLPGKEGNTAGRQWKNLSITPPQEVRTEHLPKKIS